MRLFGDMDNEEMRMQLNNIIKVGRVHSINPQKATVQVYFYDDDSGDGDSLVSYHLQVVQNNTYKNKDYFMPDKGEDVLCLFLPHGSIDGFVLGSVYAGGNTPPESTEDKRTVVFADDTKVSYDRSTHHLSVEIEETKITANRGRVTIDTPLDVSITAGSDVKVKAYKLMVEGGLGSTLGASGVITAASVATVTNGVVTAIS